MATLPCLISGARRAAEEAPARAAGCCPKRSAGKILATEGIPARRKLTPPWPVWRRASRCHVHGGEGGTSYVPSTPEVRIRFLRVAIPDPDLRYLSRARATASARSEERRVGKECRSRWSPYH